VATGDWQVPDAEPGPAPGLAFAGYGERLVAYIVDVVIVSLVCLAVIVVGGLAVGLGSIGGGAGAAIGGSLLLFLVIFIISVGYFPFFWARVGATPGMKMFGLLVVRDSDGGPITTGQAVLRLVGYWVSGLVLYLGYIWVFIDKRRRGWHDLIAGTVVVQRR
jgi:uncharacterized RDD family membrane protein YckC